MHHEPYLQPIVDFLVSIGIPVIERPIAGSTFLPGIELGQGRLEVDRQRLVWPGDLLHEAGHLAVLPAAHRHTARGDRPNTGDIEYASELEAMAWAYAAAVEIGIPLDVLLHEGGYRGASAAIRQMYEIGVVPGLRGLCAIGMTASPGFTTDGGPVHYPRMLAWLRE